MTAFAWCIGLLFALVATALLWDAIESWRDRDRFGAALLLVVVALLAFLAYIAVWGLE